MALLEIRDCSLSFGGLAAVAHVDLCLEAGELIALIGPNGAGKTTVFNLVSGVYTPDGGDIRFAGKSIAGLAPHRINRRGIARTFQGIRLFRSMTAFENVLVGFHRRARMPFGTLLRSVRAERARSRAEADCDAILAMVGLEEQRDTPAAALPYGSQRRLEIARALATQPKLLLLDEPAAGMTPHEKLELMDRIRWLRDTLGLAILIIEHDMKLVMDICERITVLDHGERIAVGPPAKIRHDVRVIEAYLGQPGQ